MSRLIDADALLKDLQESYESLRLIHNTLRYDNEKQICAGQLTTFIECCLRVKEAPTIEAEPVRHGRWLSVRNGRGVCSECHRQDAIDPLATHCRYCGARMDKEDA